MTSNTSRYFGRVTGKPILISASAILIALVLTFGWLAWAIYFATLGMKLVSVAVALFLVVTLVRRGGMHRMSGGFPVEATVSPHALALRTNPGVPAELTTEYPRKTFRSGGLLKDLNLTQAQKDQIKAKLEADRPAKPTDAEIAQWKANHEAMRTQMTARLQTFVGTSFDANAFVAPPAGGTPAEMGPGKGGDHFAKELQAIVSVLDATQREALAKKLEAGPPAHQAPPAQP